MRKAKQVKIEEELHSPSQTHQGFTRSIRLNFNDLMKRREEEKKFDKINNLKIIGLASSVAVIILIILNL